MSKVHSLLIEENRNNNTDYEDHSENGSHHPDESVPSRLHGPRVHVRSHDWIRVGAGCERFLRKPMWLTVGCHNKSTHQFVMD